MDVLYSFISDGLSEFFDQDFANSEHTALKIIASMLVASVLTVVIYYKVIDSVAFNKKRHWFLALVVAFVISGICGYLFISGDFQAYKDSDDASDITVSDMDCFLVGLMNAIYSAIVYFLGSIGIKKFSHNCPVTPF